MRSFEDNQGHTWQAALLDGSYGQVLLVLSRVGDGAVWQCQLDVANRAQAEQRLTAMDTAALRAALAAAEPWMHSPM